MTAGGSPHPGFEAARRVADAVLHEGYVLYPYRASSAKNHLRWQFGVLAPRGWCEAGGPEAWFARTEVLLRPGPGARVDVRLRALRLQARQVEEATGAGAGAYAPVASLVVDDRRLVTWDEGLEVTLDAAGLDLADLERGAVSLPVALAG
ncbi:MAG TPA: hypothetical protein VE152_07825, partial [Acidimicrobiales bacterium]|nr:hypothetical protein [Acidimicrobiales bacterium]